MTRRRWMADEVAGDRAALTGGHADHLVHVLRARVGQEFDISTGSVVRRGRIASITDSRVEFDLQEELPASPTPSVALVLAVFKFDRMEWAIEKCTEIGVATIIPVISRRTESHLAAAAAKRLERWRRIAQQSAEQSRRVSPPKIADPIKLADIVRSEAGLRIVLSENEKELPLKDALAERSADSQSPGLILAIGPEGGWTADELQAFQQNNWMSASLGPTILRAETAAIVASAISISELS